MANGQNANKLTGEQRANLRERLQQDRPEQLLPPTWRQSQGPFWTGSDLQIAVKNWSGVVYPAVGSYRNLFHRCGFSYQRAERVYHSRPPEVEIAAFQAELEKK